MEGADNRFKNICARHNTLENAILVVHEPNVHRGVPQYRDNVSRVERLRNDRSVPNQFPNVRLVPG